MNDLSSWSLPLIGDRTLGLTMLKLAPGASEGVVRSSGRVEVVIVEELQHGWLSTSDRPSEK